MPATALDTARPRILFLDAYDSFANNITALLATLLGADVHVLPIDAQLTEDAFHAELACYDAVVCGPGPGSPDCPADIGLMKHVWAAGSSRQETTRCTPTPALGICLGFQSLVAAHGGRIRRLRSGGLHGMVRSVETNPAAGDIFAGVAAPFRATLYHSLGADIGQDTVTELEWPAARWLSPQASPELVPLAWVEEETETAGVERLLMGVRHRVQPFWGLQYHPESVCTDAASHAVLANWFRAAVQWNAEHGRVRAEPSPLLLGDGLAARQATRPGLLSLQPSVLGKTNGLANGANYSNVTRNGNGTSGTNGTSGKSKHSILDHPSATRLISRTIPLPGHLEVPDLVEALQAGQAQGSEPEQIILDSASAATDSSGTNSAPDNDGIANDEAVRGRYSIIALDVGRALKIEYRTGDRLATVRVPHGMAEAITVPLRGTQTIWQLLAEFHEHCRLSFSAGDADTAGRPFLGGFMGYISYEQGLGDIGVPLPDAGVDGGGRGHDRPDVCFAWVTRSIVVDHVLGVVHVQHLDEGDVESCHGANGANGANGTKHTSGVNRKAHQCWVDDVVSQLQASTQWQQKTQQKPAAKPAKPPQTVSMQLPDVEAYEDKVCICQEHIAAGDSYELCLTDETRISVASPTASSSAWHYYRTLRRKSPSPFASYLRLGGATLVSSSPERFLCFSPSPDPATGTTLCSMRPMKGTVRRSAEVATLAQAEAVLHVPKEEAENLMIVDLVRHDLHGVCGPGHVTVPRLLQVEPYGHVFQMVTVVEGELPASQTAGAGYTGLDVLAASLPPGSMTGAPKKRSCALLQALERRPASPRSTPGQRVAPGERSLYSGVVGYLCVTGRGDWSVTIRSMFRWDDETTMTSDDDRTTRQDVWHIGAGGAVTILSTPEGERDEMFVKLSGPLGIFDI
ncbi:hypothetical protein SCUCBS95973_005489 [Sporothrix curviconia]|uniref:aminodeoxychorismate synthase n=1 Tax=Sporothrix curviconia TaxID=1260050 RepID=A0ABP0BY16_9PEZI